MKVAMRQIAGAFAQLEKSRLVRKLRKARERKRAAAGKCEGRKSYGEARPEVVAVAKELQAASMSLRKISAELAARGYAASAHGSLWHEHEVPMCATNVGSLGRSGQQCCGAVMRAIDPTETSTGFRDQPERTCRHRRKCRESFEACLKRALFAASS
jgi:hypothetical protein